jgi:hypothetical protein
MCHHHRRAAAARRRRLWRTRARPRGSGSGGGGGGRRASLLHSPRLGPGAGLRRVGGGVTHHRWLGRAGVVTRVRLDVGGGGVVGRVAAERAVAGHGVRVLVHAHIIWPGSSSSRRSSSHSTAADGIRLRGFPDSGDFQTRRAAAWQQQPGCVHRGGEASAPIWSSPGNFSGLAGSW